MYTKNMNIGRSTQSLPKIDSIAYDNVIVGGVGGSALVARALFFLDPMFPIWLHDTYDLPAKSEGNTLYVAISYSGNTAETLSFARGALAKGRPLAVITSGGELLKLAKDNKLTHIAVPSGFQPREALVHMLRALMRVLGKEDMLREIDGCAVDTEAACSRGRDIASGMLGKIPLIYSSRDNQVLAYIWKVMFNESAKVPAFSNYFPELRHNEIQGIVHHTDGLKILLLADDEDDDKIRREMSVLRELVSSSAFSVMSIGLPSGKADKLIFTLAASSGAAQALAEHKGVSPSEVPFIELFKKSL